MARKRPTEMRIVTADHGLALDPSPVPGRCRVALRGPADVARELSRVYRAVRSGALPSGEGCRLAFLLTSLNRVFADALFDERLRALEQQQGHLHGDARPRNAARAD